MSHSQERIICLSLGCNMWCKLYTQVSHQPHWLTGSGFGLNYCKWRILLISLIPTHIQFSYSMSLSHRLYRRLYPRSRVRTEVTLALGSGLSFGDISYDPGASTWVLCYAAMYSTYLYQDMWDYNLHPSMLCHSHQGHTMILQYQATSS